MRANKKRKFSLTILVLLFFWSILIGYFLADKTPAINPSVDNNLLAQVGAVDPVPKRYELGQELYIENCSTCHIALPPQVLPTETWRQILQDKQHYGIEIKLPIDPPRLLIWNYIQAFSRPQPKNEPVSYRMGESRYFKILHPLVKLPNPPTMDTCITCHQGANKFDFRSLTPAGESP